MNLLNILGLIATVFGVNTNTFTPGTYTIKPSDYNNNKKITIELWGGGSSGSACTGKAGSSAGYVKTIYNTNGNTTFTINVGKGGQSNLNYVNCNNPYFVDQVYNGSDTTIYANNNLLYRAGGGKWNLYLCSNNFLIYPCYLSSGGKNQLLVTNDTSVIYNLTGFSELVLSQYNPTFTCYKYTNELNFHYYNNNGGQSPYGGLGGFGAVYSCNGFENINCTVRMYPSNGVTPGGGGGSSGFSHYNYLSSNYQTCVQNVLFGPTTSGGDGLLRIYY
jgi:hypothetical protein